MPVTERHWHYHLGSDGIAWLTLDKADSTVNVLSDAVLTELDDELKKLAATPPRALVVKSGKATGYILGADVKEFGRIHSAPVGAELAARGQAIFARIEGLGIPTDAAIDGFVPG